MQDAPRPTVTVDEIETLLSRLPGVLSSRVVVNNWGAIEEIHILSNTERNPKQMVRDVESSLAARWGITIDHKKISVAQLAPLSTKAGPSRVKLLNVVLTNDTQKGRLSAKVVLTRLDEAGTIYEGSAEGNNSRYQSFRVVCQAAIAALNQVIEPQNVFVLEDVGALFLSKREVAVVAVSLVTARGNEELLVGAAPVRGDVLEAAVKATLDAANRRLGNLQPKRPPEEERTEAPG
ncbi:MAG: hypothetical protein NUV93_05570 [Firmicutes bacterium]|jgi:hypothetical protein|nr:hypothetical protein [Bacillota bacterium]